MTTKSEVREALKRLQEAVHEFLRPIYFDGIPATALAALVAEHGFDPSDFAGIYCGNQGRAFCQIGFGRGLALSWYRMPSGRFEIVAYVS